VETVQLKYRPILSCIYCVKVATSKFSDDSDGIAVL